MRLIAIFHTSTDKPNKSLATRGIILLLERVAGPEFTKNETEFTPWFLSS